MVSGEGLPYSNIANQSIMTIFSVHDQN
uniref:Uncharacterized protein n=1 Tax=Rhizophora mucronata TaxID=61149 RepID=A0A2P2QJZ8_RHIMU